jgi:hypothetical protein
MARLWCLRVASVFAAMALAFILVSLDPYFGAAQVAPGAGHAAPAFSVNRALKGDRLPLFHPLVDQRSDPPAAARRDLPGPDGLQTQRKVPLGCDPAFSPVSAPSLSTLYGRCMV